MTSFLVTGAAGLIGSHLCAALLARGDHVTGVDNFLSGRRANLVALHQDTKFTFIEHDVMDPLPTGTAYAAIYHLACPASPPHYQQDPVRTLRINVQGTYHMLELARATGAIFLQASTSEVYGDPEVHPQPEHYVGHVNPIGPRACYDEGKRAAETLCFDMHRQYRVPIKVARIFNTYGPHMRADDGRVISNLLTQALSGVPMTLYGDGQQTRSFCYVSDMVEGLVALMESPPGITGPINLGNPEEYTMEALAEKILAYTGSSSPVVYRPLPIDDPRQRRPDIRLAKETLSWQPKITLDRGLAKTIEWFRTHQET